MENDADAYWHSLCTACQRLWANTRVPKDAIAGAVITAQRGTLVPLDAKGQPTFHSPQGIAATQAYLDVLLRHKVAPAASASFNETDAVNSVAQGKTAMVSVWWWRYAGLTDAKTSTLKPEQVGFAPLPAMPGKDATMEYQTWLTQPENERSVLLDRTRNEVVAVQTRNLIDGDVNLRYGGMHLFGAQALKGARGVPLFPQWSQVSGIVEAAINELASGKAQVKPTLEAAAARVKRALR